MTIPERRSDKAHAPLPVDARHFDRWLSLFEETAAEVCPPPAAEQFVVRARRIAQSLELGVAIHNGQARRRQRPRSAARSAAKAGSSRTGSA